jgi:probable rRNA maturation factor
MEPPSTLTVLFRAVPSVLKIDRRGIRAFAELTGAKVAEGRPFTCLITSDEALRKLNREFLGRDYATDVLSFPNGAMSPDLGEIAISAERADEQGREFGHSVTDEIRVLMLHGILHLIGFDHERDSGEMTRAEQKWRRELGLPETLISRNGAVATIR